MNRRKLLQTLAVGSMGLSLPKETLSNPFDDNLIEMGKSVLGSFAIDQNHVRFFNPQIKKRFAIMMLADTHLFRDDIREDPFRQYSGRMSKAYNQTKHFQTGALTTPEDCFQNTIQLAKDSNVDLIALVGDIFSFPSESAIEWVEEKLKKIDLPYVYTAGNHDWHYEGMEGTSTQLRSTWIQKRLLPLYQGSNPLMSSKEIHGIRFVTIDNSNYEILPEQLAFFNKEKQLGKPILLMVHIPLFASERPLGFGCGHPDWNAKNDRNFKLERRLPWSETGHSKTTMEFHKEVFRSENLLGILAGHIHEQSLDVVNGIPQIVTQANATGAYLHVEFVP